MKRVLLLALVVVAAIAVAVAAAAPSTQKAQAAKGANPAKTCKAERASIGDDAFATKYGTNPSKRNAFGKCVSKIAKSRSGGQDEEGEDEKAEKAGTSAAKKCRTAGNAAKIGAGKPWRNFGACVKAQKKTS